MLETKGIFAAIQKAANTIATPNCAAWLSAIAALAAVVAAIIIAIKQNKIAKQQTEIAAEQNKFSEEQTQIAAKQIEFTEKQTQIAENQDKLAEKQTEISEQQNRIALFEKRFDVYWASKRIIKVSSSLEDEEVLTVPV